MTYFESDIVVKALEQTYAFIKVALAENVLTITLDRAEKKNALHPKMVDEIAFALQYAHSNGAIWAVVFEAEGNVFCAGADLKAFMGMIGEFDSSIPESSQEILIAELFAKVHKPIISKIQGNVYAGGLFFLAGSTYVLANEKVMLALPEVKRGLYPFQVMAALMKVMPRRQVVDWCIRGYSMQASQAEKQGLVTHLTTSQTIDQVAAMIITELKENSPSAIRLGLEALEHIETHGSEHKYLMEMLVKAVSTNDGQEGLQAFREKRKPVWKGN